MVLWIFFGKKKNTDNLIVIIIQLLDEAINPDYTYVEAKLKKAKMFFKQQRNDEAQRGGSFKRPKI